MENFLHCMFFNKCYLCDQSGDPICSSCFSRFILFKNDSSKYFTLFEFNDIAKKLLYLSKYPPYYFYLLKYLMIKSFKDWREEMDRFFNFSSKYQYLCPVPLSNQKLFDRTFNQSEIIAETLESEFKIPYFNFLKRRIDTPALYELNKDQRRVVLNNAFKASLSFIILKPRVVILIDDLMTTRQTLLNCSKILLEKGVFEVRYFTLFAKK